MTDTEPNQSTSEQLAEIGFNAYRAHVREVAADGSRIPEWDQVTHPYVQTGWAAAADAIRETVLRELADVVKEGMARGLREINKLPSGPKPVHPDNKGVPRPDPQENIAEDDPEL